MSYYCLVNEDGNIRNSVYTSEKGEIFEDTTFVFPFKYVKCTKGSIKCVYDGVESTLTSDSARIDFADGVAYSLETLEDGTEFETVQHLPVFPDEPAPVEESAPVVPE